MMTEVSYPYFQTSLMKEVYSTEGGIDSPDISLPRLSPIRT
jgi:hypothetical protein